MAEPRRIDLGIGYTGGRGIDIVPIYISAPTRDVAHAVEQALRDLFLVYGYDDPSFLDRREFEGSWKIVFRWTSHTQITEQGRTVERDVLFDLSREPAAIDNSVKREANGRLKAILEKTKALLVVGTLFIGTVAAAKELVDAYQKQSPTAPSIEIQIEKPPESISCIRLPPTVLPVIDHADRSPRNTELFLGYVIYDECRQRKNSRSSSPPSTPPSSE